MRFRLFAVAALVAVATVGCRPEADARQVVQKDRDAVYSAFADAFSQGAVGGASQYSNLWNGGLQVVVEKTPTAKLKVITKFDGNVANEIHFTFTDEDGGKATLVRADVTVDREVVRKAFTDTPQGKLADLPASAYKVGMQKLMAKYASRIEAGTPLNVPEEGWMTSASEPPPEFYEGMPEDMRATVRQHEEERRLEAAAAPMIDPDAASRQFLRQ